MTLKSYLILWLAVIGLLLSSTGNPVRAASYHDFLRINKVYVLYTDPIVPHADYHGNFWVGLAPTAMLIGAKLTESPDGRATLDFEKHHLVLTPDAKSAFLDCHIIKLPAAPKRVGPMHQLVVPIVPILVSLGLHSRWNSKYQILTITDTDLIDKGEAGEFIGFLKQFEGPPRGYAAQVIKFAGPPYLISPVFPVSLAQNGTDLIWRLNNESKVDYKMDINLFKMGSSGEELFSSGIQFPLSYPDPPDLYPIEADNNYDLKLSTADMITYDQHNPLPFDVSTWKVTKHIHKVSAIVAWIVL